MARYRILEKAIIDGRLVEPGEEVEFDGVPGPHMKLLEEDKPPAKPAERAPEKPTERQVPRAREEKDD